VGEVGFTDLVRQFLNVITGEFGIDARSPRTREFAGQIVAVNHALTFPNEVLTA
jgi:hypothetical protein